MKLKKLEYRSLWFKKMYYYLHAGQSLSDAAGTAASDMDTRYIHEELASGLRLSQVCRLTEFEKIFSATEVSLISVAEQTGNMEEVCRSLGELLKSQHTQKQKLVAAAIYPGLVLCMAFCLLLMILTVIVPKIGPLFSGMRDLPVATRVLMSLSDHVTNLWYVDLLIVATVFVLHLTFRNREVYAAALDRAGVFISQKTPYVKGMFILWHVERWMQVTHMSLSSKVPIAEALAFASVSVSDIRTRKSFAEVQVQVANGSSCAAAMTTLPQPILSKVSDWISIIASGERTGSLRQVFEVCHAHIRENMLETIDRFQKMVEPILIICVGMMVLSICLSIILPMYQLTQSLQ